MMDHDGLSATLAPLGLQILGHTATTETDPGGAGQTLVLIGPDEPGFWPIFAKSPEMADGAPDALDRWSARVLGDVGKEVGGRAVFPFGGPPFLPFLTWAQRSGRFWPSPINFVVHDSAGLFVSFRGAIILPGVWPTAPAPVKPCLTCAAPCATACPVDAFADGYDVAACKAHVTSEAGDDCRTAGCLARRACPVGQGHRLPAQANFHMEAFL